MSDKAKASGKRSRRTRILAGLGIFFLLLAAAIGALKNHFAIRERERDGALAAAPPRSAAFTAAARPLRKRKFPS